MPLSLEIDLVVEVEGATIRLQGSGRRLRAESSAFRPLLGSGLSRAGLRRLAELLDRHGFTLDVVDASGTLLSLGSGVDSRLGSLLFASPRIDPRRPLTLSWRLLR